MVASRGAIGQAGEVDDHSLLNTVRAVLAIRQQEPALQEGSIELLEHLPAGVLGYMRTLDSGKIWVFLNFDEHRKEFQAVANDVLFRLSGTDQARDHIIHLDGYGGMILK